jgi:hypothetical protein
MGSADRSTTFMLVGCRTRRATEDLAALVREQPPQHVRFHTPLIMSSY